MARTIRSLLLMAVLGAGLALYNLYSNNREVGLATGPLSPQQKAFFVEASERPDLMIFFKSLTTEQRASMAMNIGRYDDKELAKLIARLLETFDTRARKELTGSLAKVAKVHPKEVAEQLSVNGSFQQLAIRSALAEAGSQVFPLVAERLTNVDARPNAIAFLVTSGRGVIPSVLPMLRHKEKDVRLAAADTLGKLRAKEAVAELVDLYRKSTADEHFGYLAAIAGIGAPITEGLLASALNDPELPEPQRSQAALGLGRVASDSAIGELWRYADAENKALRESSISALQVAGDRALAIGLGSPLNRIRVAEGIQSPLADRVLLAGLESPGLRMAASQASHDRTALVDRLTQELKALNPEEAGDLADNLIAALASTELGKQRLAALHAPLLAGMIERRLALTSLKS